MVWQIDPPGVEEQGKEVIGVPREAGRASRPPWTCRIGSPGSTRTKLKGCFDPWVRRKQSEHGNRAGEKKRAAGMGEGSLSVCIVAFESGVTRPREPMSSQGGHRVTDP